MSMDKFEKIKGEAGKMGLSAKTIKKVLTLIEYAEAYDVMFYLEGNTLRMKDNKPFFKKYVDSETFADRSEKRFYDFARKFFRLK